MRLKWCVALLGLVMVFFDSSWKVVPRVVKLLYLENCVVSVQSPWSLLMVWWSTVVNPPITMWTQPSGMSTSGRVCIMNKTICVVLQFCPWHKYFLVNYPSITKWKLKGISSPDWRTIHILEIDTLKNGLAGPTSLKTSLRQGQFNIMYLDNTRNTRKVLLCAKWYI